MPTRRNYRDLSLPERTQLVTVLTLMKMTGVIDRLAAAHAAFFDFGMHRTSHFLPWHRRFVSMFEKQAQRYVPGLALPYWDSTVDRSPSDPLWDQSFMGQFDSAWNLRRWLTGGANLPKEVREILGIRDGDVPHLATTANLADHLKKASYRSFCVTTENAYHDPPHRWVGGAMRGRSAPADPVFYLHHCWIDRMWAQWQEADGAVRFDAFETFASAGHAGHAGAFGPDDQLFGLGGTARQQFDYRALGYDYVL